MTFPPPEHYRHTDDTAISNLDGIGPSAEESLKADEIVMDFAAWSFHGLVWFCRERLRFCCEVSRHGRAVETVVGETLDEIRGLVSDFYGHE